jgi:hypothetical protein
VERFPLNNADLVLPLDRLIFGLALVDESIFFSMESQTLLGRLAVGCGILASQMTVRKANELFVCIYALSG